jgi:pyruvate dehydrogenase E2 component (dihydrolipoamide acetyltransferase)
MAFEIIMPKFGQTMTEGTIVSWEKQAGDPVSKGDVILKVESDKAVLDVEAEYDGTLLKILTGEGIEVPCGEVIGYIGTPGEQI